MIDYRFNERGRNWEPPAQLPENYSDSRPAADHDAAMIQAGLLGSAGKPLEASRRGFLGWLAPMPYPRQRKRLRVFLVGVAVGLIGFILGAALVQLAQLVR